MTETVGTVEKTVWRGGWLAGALRRESPHRHPRPAGMRAELLVVHCISLPRGVFCGDDVERLFCGALDCASRPEYSTLSGLRVSAHFFIRRGGEIMQFVSAEECAWHAGESKFDGRANCNDFSVGAELEGTEGGEFERAQYASLIALTRALAARAGGIFFAAGHEHIAPGRKSDPGAGFNWEYFFSETGGEYDGRKYCGT